jgi:glycosyltransferase involved in cell wall biosynthesis
MLGFARHLPRFGWRVRALAPPCLPWEPVDEQLLKQLPRDCVVHAVPYPQSRAIKILRRFAPNGIWLPPAYRALRRIVAESRPDAVLTSGPPQCVHVLGLWLKRRYGMSWAADFRDPWVVGDRQENWRSLRVWLARRCERAILRNADLVIANAPRACARLRAGYPVQQDKIVVVTNGFDPEKPSPRCAPGRSCLEIVHAGDIYFGRDPRPFLDALRGDDAGDTRVRFLGRATGGDLDLTAEARARGLDRRVESVGQVSYEASRRAMANADILLLLDSPGRKVGVPAKLYEYLGAGAAILALTEPDGDAAWVLRESGVLHRIAPPRDVQCIRRAIAELTACILAGQAIHSAPDRLAAFTRESTASVLANHLDTLVAREEAPLLLADQASTSERERQAGLSLAARVGENELPWEK